MPTIETARKQISCPPGYLAAFRTEAQNCGQSLSAWLGDCCVASLPAAVKRRLSERKPSRTTPHGPPRSKGEEWRFIFSAPADHFPAFQAAAKAAGYAVFSEWVCMAGRANLEAAAAASLPEWPANGRRKSDA